MNGAPVDIKDYIPGSYRVGCTEPEGHMRHWKRALFLVTPLAVVAAFVAVVSGEGHADDTGAAIVGSTEG